MFQSEIKLNEVLLTQTIWKKYFQSEAQTQRFFLGPLGDFFSFMYTNIHI